MRKYTFLKESYSVGEFTIAPPYGAGIVQYVDDNIISVYITVPYSEEYKNQTVTIPNLYKKF